MLECHRKGGGVTVVVLKELSLNFQNLSLKISKVWGQNGRVGKNQMTQIFMISLKLLSIRDWTTVAIFCTDLVLCFHVRKLIVHSKNVQ